MNKQNVVAQTMEYLAVKRKEILINALTRMNIQEIMLGEISKTQKYKYCMIPLIWGTESSQNFMETESGLVVARGWLVREMQLVFNRHRVSIWEDEK